MSSRATPAAASLSRKFLTRSFFLASMVRRFLNGADASTRPLSCASVSLSCRSRSAAVCRARSSSAWSAAPPPPPVCSRSPAASCLAAPRSRVACRYLLRSSSTSRPALLEPPLPPIGPMALAAASSDLAASRSSRAASSCSPKAVFSLRIAVIWAWSLTYFSCVTAAASFALSKSRAEPPSVGSARATGLPTPARTLSAPLPP
mmetsp:Transcript_29366/g.78880  ORF Transcript_29366/g.78880 Transcript_29366/m.78880 type:complete len:204 (+) Transcript_29366:397-1008(+)